MIMNTLDLINRLESAILALRAAKEPNTEIDIVMALIDDLEAFEPIIR